MRTATISTKGRVVIPKDLRGMNSLKKGTQVHVVDCGKMLALVPLPDDPVDALRSMLEGDPSLTADSLSEPALERAHEESRGE